MELREIAHWLHYLDQRRLSRVSRNFYRTLNKLRNDISFWRECCKLQNVPFNPNYTAAQNEYWFYFIVTYRDYVAIGARLRQRLHTSYPPFFDIAVLKDSLKEVKIEPSYIKHHLRDLTVNATTQGASSEVISSILALTPRDYPMEYIRTIVDKAIEVSNTSVYYYLRKQYPKIITLDYLRRDLALASSSMLDFYAINDPVVLNSPRAVAHIASPTLSSIVLPILKKYLAKFDLKKIGDTYERIIWYRKRELLDAMRATGHLNEPVIVYKILSTIDGLSINAKKEVDISGVNELIGE